MADGTQNFANHKRNFVLFHNIAAPLLAIYMLYTFYALVRAPSVATAASVVLGVGIFALLFASRTMTLTVQNRVIRLEMQLRLAHLLGAAAASEAVASLKLSQLMALRFASDAELPGLIARVRSNELATSTDTKKAVREWQADHLRA